MQQLVKAFWNALGKGYAVQMEILALVDKIAV
jgi:hypothetical protein